MALISLEDANTYFSNKLHVEAWTDATDTEKSQALESATVQIERLSFIVPITDPAQDNVQYACAELALRLLDGVDPEMEIENLRMSTQLYGPVRASYNSHFTPEYIMAGIPSIRAWAYLKPYLKQDKGLNLHRTS